MKQPGLNLAFGSTMFALIMSLIGITNGGTEYPILDKIIFVINVALVYFFTYTNKGIGNKFNLRIGIIFAFIFLYSYMFSIYHFIIVITMSIYLLIGLKKPKKAPNLTKSWIGYFYKYSKLDEKIIALLFIVLFFFLRY